MDGLAESGLFSHPQFSLDIFHSGEATRNLDAVLEYSELASFHRQPNHLHFNEGVVWSIKSICEKQPDFLLFFEDDVHVCKDFPEFVVASLERVGASPLLDYVTYYSEIKNAYLEGHIMHEMPAKSFYGTQCLAMSLADAESFASYVDANKQTKSGFADVWFDDWLSSVDRDRHVKCSVPSAAQHIGSDSNHGHEFIVARGFKDDLECIVPKPTDEFLLLEVDNETSVLRHRKTNAHLALNDSALLIYLLCDGVNSLKALTAEIMNASGLDAYAASQQVRTYLNELSVHDAIQFNQ